MTVRWVGTKVAESRLLSYTTYLPLYKAIEYTYFLQLFWIKKNFFVMEQKLEVLLVSKL